MYKVCLFIQHRFQTIKQLNPCIVVEIGSGSGVVSVFLQQMLIGCCGDDSDSPPPNVVFSLCTDLNPNACRTTKRTASLNFNDDKINARHLNLDAVNCDLLDAMRERLAGKIDVLVFNPPYVPTSEHEADEAKTGTDPLVSHFI